MRARAQLGLPTPQQWGSCLHRTTCLYAPKALQHQHCLHFKLSATSKCTLRQLHYPANPLHCVCEPGLACCPAQQHRHQLRSPGRRGIEPAGRLHHRTAGPGELTAVCVPVWMNLHIFGSCGRRTKVACVLSLRKLPGCVNGVRRVPVYRLQQTAAVARVCPKPAATDDPGRQTLCQPCCLLSPLPPQPSALDRLPSLMLNPLPAAARRPAKSSLALCRATCRALLWAPSCRPSAQPAAAAAPPVSRNRNPGPRVAWPNQLVTGLGRKV